MELFKTYSEFLKLRDSLIAYAIKGATYTEDRDGEKVRPLTVIRTESELRKVNAMIAKWHLLADELNAGDPVRYSRTSVIFSPEPKVLHNQAEIFIKVNAATSTRTISRQNIIKRLKDLRRVSYLSEGNSRQTKRYAKEITFFNKETEEKYRIRSEGYTEVLLLHRAEGEDELTKTRVPFAGIFVFDPKKTCSIHMPEHGRDYVRSDKLANMGIKPIMCSLNIRGVLLRESDIIKAKNNNVAEKLAEHMAKNKAIEAARIAKLEASKAQKAAEKQAKLERAAERAANKKARELAKAKAVLERATAAAERAAKATAEAEAKRRKQEAEKLKRAADRKAKAEKAKIERAEKRKADRAAAKVIRQAARAQLKAEAAAKAKAERELQRQQIKAEKAAAKLLEKGKDATQ